MQEPVIEARGLSKTYGDIAAVQDLSFEVRRGRVTGFLGPNGAGKTTTMRMLLALATPTAGRALVLGRPYTELADPQRQVGVALDADTFHPRRSARNHLRWLAEAGGIPIERVDRVLDEVDLEGAADRRVGGFSLGMRQRLSLAAALLGDPTVLVLDEPMNGLDPAGIRWMRKYLRDFAERGGAVFVSSHLLAEVARLADDVIVVSHGSLVVQTTVAELTGGNDVDLEDVFLELTEEVDHDAAIARI